MAVIYKDLSDVHNCLYPDQLLYWIAYNNDLSIVVNGTVDIDQQISTALDHLELLSSLEDVIARYSELGVTYIPNS